MVSNVVTTLAQMTYVVSLDSTKTGTLLLRKNFSFSLSPSSLPDSLTHSFPSLLFLSFSIRPDRISHSLGYSITHCITEDDSEYHIFVHPSNTELCLQPISVIFTRPPHSQAADRLLIDLPVCLCFLVPIIRLACSKCSLKVKWILPKKSEQVTKTAEVSTESSVFSDWNFK